MDENDNFIFQRSCLPSVALIISGIKFDREKHNLLVRWGSGGNGHFTTFSVGHQECDIKLTLSDRRFWKNVGSKRSRKR